MSVTISRETFSNIVHDKFVDDKNIETLTASILYTFYIRSIRNGMGDRDWFYDLFIDDICYVPKVITELFDEIVSPETGGYFKDLNNLVLHVREEIGEDSDEASLTLNKVVDYYAQSLYKDYSKAVFALPYNRKFSLAAKYTPTEGTKFWKLLGVPIAYKFYGYIHRDVSKPGQVFKFYRKSIGIIRQNLDIVERHMSLNEWDKINLTNIPHRALLRYRDVFENRSNLNFSDRLDLEEKYIGLHEDLNISPKSRTPSNFYDNFMRTMELESFVKLTHKIRRLVEEYYEL